MGICLCLEGIVTRRVVVEDALGDQMLVQVQLTLVFSSAPQRGVDGERDVGQVFHEVSRTRVNALIVSFVNNGQNNSRTLAHINFTPELGVIVSGEVKTQSVWGKKTEAQHVTEDFLFWTSSSTSKLGAYLLVLGKSLNKLLLG